MLRHLGTPESVQATKPEEKKPEAEERTTRQITKADLGIPNFCHEKNIDPAAYDHLMPKPELVEAGGNVKRRMIMDFSSGTGKMVEMDIITTPVMK
jgi:hypothetical protein